jgi:pyridoxal phosphate enzyme (YggS family)
VTGRAEEIASNLRAVRDRIEHAGGDPNRVRIVAVAKRFDAETVAAALAAGIVDIGESYAQELHAAVAGLDDLLPPHVPRPRWHFVGRIQRNKIGALAPIVDLWHSVDRVEAGTAIARAAPGAAVLAQVNTSGEPQKGGCAPRAAPALVAALRDAGLDVRGLMTIGPLGEPDAARRAFRSLRELADDLALPERSMGMTADLEIAIEEGATIVRVGTALFGSRPGRRQAEH